VELPATADVDDIDAEQRNGMLTVCVKKLPTAHAKRIDVKTSRRELVGATR
jgi:HSP20 family molecular chaperone IbpA